MDKNQQKTLLIANRGEIAIRIARAAQLLGLKTIGIFAEDDQASLHVKKVGQAIALNGKGAAAYLDVNQIINIAKTHHCQLIHPGYGFLSERADFANACKDAGIRFVGPDAKLLEMFGDKTQARQLAQQLDIPTIPGTFEATSLEECSHFFDQLKEGESLLIKACGGGGGRGMRLIEEGDNLKEVYQRAASEAEKAFGSSELYLEKKLSKVKHIEVQIIGDQQGSIIALGERECSLQRRNQKLVEIAPCPGLSPELRQKLIDASLKMAKAVNYTNAGTFEFLVNESLAADADFYFLEVNPRIQVEHTVTEEVYGVDLVKAQLQIAQGQNLQETGLDQSLVPRGYAIQLRINAENLQADGTIKAGIGKVKTLTFPTGKGIRSDSSLYQSYANSPNYDPLLAKLICHADTSDFNVVLQQVYHSLCECQIDGIPTNLDLLKTLILRLQQLDNWNTQFIDTNLPHLLDAVNHPHHYFENEAATNIDYNTQYSSIPEGLIGIEAPLPGTILEINVEVGAKIQAGEALLIIEAMKMETLVTAQQSGIINEIRVEQGDLVLENDVLFIIDLVEDSNSQESKETNIDPDYIRPDLAEVIQRKSYLKDENRPGAVEKRRKYGQYTARENIAALCDPDSFSEYGGLIIAAQRRRRKFQDLVENTPADGLVSGIGNINGKQFGPERSKCMVLAYDYTVLAGTQGALNHKKMDRMLHLAQEWSIPIIIFAEGGGGRPGDIDFPVVAALDVMTFTLFARLSGKIPRISIVSRYCFAGNAALAGCADVIIATENTSLGMGGPAMIEGGGLGKHHPKDVGPADVQTKNGVIDILVKDEMEAIKMAQKYLSYFQGNHKEWTCEDQRLLRSAIPENRRRVYDIRALIEQLADTDSVLELRKDFGLGMVTAFARVEGRPIGIIANNPKHLGGAIDSEGADKSARFMQLCNAFNIPILTLVDTPGIMVGPDAEKSGTVRHASRLFVIGGTLNVPVFTIILRKGYGLGAQVMAGGSFHVPAFTIAWPSGEFGAMGLEGAVKLGFRKELEQVEDPEERQALYEKMVAKAYDRGKGINMASLMEIDDVIDPADSRKWILTGLDSIPKEKYKDNNQRIIDTW
jgi:acetyl/propionyl-CoA carboxylase alpha subunit